MRFMPCATGMGKRIGAIMDSVLERSAEMNAEQWAVNSCFADVSE